MSSKDVNIDNVCNLPLESGGLERSGDGLYRAVSIHIEKALEESAPTRMEKVRISIFLGKRNGVGTEQDSVREGFLEEVAIYPLSPSAFSPAGLSALPSIMSLFSVPVRRCFCS